MTCSHDASAEPLAFLMNILIKSVSSAHPDLTNRQLALLLTVYLEPSPHTVRGLSTCLSLTKPVVSRALQHLESFGFLKRLRGLSDRRDMFVERTPIGAAYLIEFSDGIDEPLPRSVSPIADHAKLPIRSIADCRCRA